MTPPLQATQLVYAVVVLTIFNPAPAIPDLDSEVCQNVDILCLNETESEIITGLTVTSVDDARAVTSILLDRGCRTVIVTLGALGTVFATKDQPEIVHMPARNVEAVDTTVITNTCTWQFEVCVLLQTATVRLSVFYILLVKGKGKGSGLI